MMILIFDGYQYLEAVKSGLIKEDDTMVAITLDGAQLYRDKDSDCYFLGWIILNLSPDRRYAKAGFEPGVFAPVLSPYKWSLNTQSISLRLRARLVVNIINYRRTRKVQIVQFRLESPQTHRSENCLEHVKPQRFYAECRFLSLSHRGKQDILKHINLVSFYHVRAFEPRVSRL